MRNSYDYYNILEDSLRDGHYQVKKIYEKISTALKENKLINIRTGYLMGERFKNINYCKDLTKRYPLCWNFPSGACVDFSVINKLFRVYTKWIEDYEKNRDLERIRKLIKKEIERAKFERDVNKREGIDDFILFEKKKYIDLENDEEEDEEEEEEKGELNSFIVDDEEEEENINENIEEVIEIESDYSDKTNNNANSTYYNSNKKKKYLTKKRSRDFFSIELFENELHIENSNSDNQEKHYKQYTIQEMFHFQDNKANLPSHSKKNIIVDD